MNPGKLMDAVRVYDPVENLRHEIEPLGAADEAKTRELETHFRICRRPGLVCARYRALRGVGACRNTTGGVMCPSYRATAKSSIPPAAARACCGRCSPARCASRAFRARLSTGSRPLPQLQSLQVRVPCAGRCGRLEVGVSGPALQGPDASAAPLHLRFADKLARWGALAPALTNALLTGPITSPLIKHIVGVAQERQLPRLAHKSYQRSRPASSETANVPRSQNNSTDANRKSAPPDVAKVVLCRIPGTNYYHRKTLAAAETVLATAGFQG